MDVIYELVRYLIILIIGILLIKWYDIKKGWEKPLRISILYIFSWKTSMLFIFLGMNFLINLFLSLLEIYSTFYDLYILYPIMLVLQSFFINLILGIAFSKLIYKQTIQESVVIILIIIIIEIIIESFILYLIIIPLTLVS